MGAGGRLLLGDGEIELKLLSSEGGQCEAKVTCGGVLKSRKGVTLVGKVFDVPALTDKDRDDARQALELDIDILALSYVKHARDVMELREIVQKTAPDVQICAKIEMRQGVQELESILRVVDAVMVARGDMGLQMEIEDVPIMQKKIIRECTAYGTPVITATQMLESMVGAPRPTRAEATDVANAVLDGSDALMLSAETSVGAYPIDCVRTMARIAEKAESLYDRQKIERQFEKASETGVRQTDAIAHCVELLAKQLRPSAILTLSTSGQTARLVSKYRPRVAVLCATSDARTHRQLALVWGVEAILVAAPIHTDDAIESAIRAFRAEKRLKVGDLVIVTAGVPAGQRGNTNLIMAEVIKE
jgi:pyruvate kinase